jgi:hypothetical protein
MKQLTEIPEPKVQAAWKQLVVCCRFHLVASLFGFSETYPW